MINGINLIPVLIQREGRGGYPLLLEGRGIRT